MADLMHILIADANEDVCAIVGTRLTKAGFLVTTAAGGSATLDALSWGVFDCAIIDAEMPELRRRHSLLSGQQAAPHARVFLTSEFEDDLSQAELQRLGAERLFTRSELLQRNFPRILQRHLNRPPCDFSARADDGLSLRTPATYSVPPAVTTPFDTRRRLR